MREIMSREWGLILLDEVSLFRSRNVPFCCSTGRVAPHLVVCWAFLCCESGLGADCGLGWPAQRSHMQHCLPSPPPAQVHVVPAAMFRRVLGIVKVGSGQLAGLPHACCLCTGVPRTSHSIALSLSAGRRRCDPSWLCFCSSCLLHLPTFC